MKISSAVFLMELEFRNVGSFLRPRNALRCIECPFFFWPINEMKLKLKGGKLECPEPQSAERRQTPTVTNPKQVSPLVLAIRTLTPWVCQRNISRKSCN